MAEAPDLEGLYKQHKDDGVMVITLIGENFQGNSPSLEDLQEWAGSFDTTHPVLADPGYGTITRFTSGGSIYLPHMAVLGPGARVVERDANGPNAVLNAAP